MAVRIYVPKLMITREHGSWAVLIVPLVISALRTGSWRAESAVLVVGVICAFLAYLPVQTLLRHFSGSRQNPDKVTSSLVWGTLFVLGSAGSMLSLILDGYVVLLAISALAICSFAVNFTLVQQCHKSVVSDLAGIAGMALGAPSLRYVTIGLLDGEAMLLYVLSVLFFGSNVVYVHMKIRAVEMRCDALTAAQKIQLGWLNLVYHLVVLSIVVVFAVRLWTPMLTVVAFLPMAVHAIYGTVALGSRVRFKRLGLLLVAHSLLFVVLFALAPGE